MVQFDFTFPNNPIKIGDNAIDNQTIIKEASRIFFLLITPISLF